MNKRRKSESAEKRCSEGSAGAVAKNMPGGRRLVLPGQSKQTAFVALCCLGLVASLAESTRGQTKYNRAVTRATSPQADTATVTDRITATPETTRRNDPRSTARLSASPGGSSDPTPLPVGPPLRSRLAEKLWQSRIVAPDPNEDAETRRALARLIKQIRSVQFGPGEQPSAFSMPVEPEQPEPSDAFDSTLDDAWEDAVAPAVVTAPLFAKLSAESAKVLQRLVQSPDLVREPLELAELLFLSDQRTEAAVFYQKALTLLDMNDATAHEDRAWILFQLGNCFREANITQAKDMYVKLIAEYPDSPWTELAKTHGRLITWYQKANPNQLVNGPKP